MHRVSPWVGVLPVVAKCAKSSLTISTSLSDESNSQFCGVSPDARHTKTVSTIDDAVP